MSEIEIIGEGTNEPGFVKKDYAALKKKFDEDLNAAFQRVKYEASRNEEGKASETVECYSRDKVKITVEWIER